ncbi:MAG: STAS domain-containing protein [Myxococcales bacterium]|nr:STAS domain-containing protein [Myxococcales bacterium]
MAIHTQLANDEVIIVISGRFDFNAHREFREAVKTVGHGSRCVVDLGDTTYLDSSALGMLLLLRDGGRDVRIVKCSDEVKKVLEIANFHRLFNVS